MSSCLSSESRHLKNTLETRINTLKNLPRFNLQTAQDTVNLTNYIG
jgi:hypothetical protein